MEEADLPCFGVAREEAREQLQQLSLKPRKASEDCCPPENAAGEGSLLQLQIQGIATIVLDRKAFLHVDMSPGG